MACNCKHSEQAIREGMGLIAELRDLFIKRMTVDSDHNDRRRRDYNQAIFQYRNESRKRHGLAPMETDGTFAVWDNMDMDMVLRCFDDAAKDWRRTWCDVDSCRRK